MRAIPPFGAASTNILELSKDARAPVTVYQFEYFDRASSRMRLADDFATEFAILEVGGTSLSGTAKTVNASRMSRAGILKRD